ncbi:TPA: nuclear transport factor 2 family protein [Raoultella planticola]|nr:nuclear transport factor 2 family protein [Raoultella planticola]
MDMPSAVQAFFAAEDLDSVVSAFTPDAVVKDEGNTYRGRQAIREWRVAARQQYQYVAEPLETIAQGDRVKVRANVSGNFPGSPVVLSYLFRLTAEQIDGLEIGDE